MLLLRQLRSLLPMLSRSCLLELLQLLVLQLLLLRLEPVQNRLHPLFDIATIVFADAATAMLHLVSLAYELLQVPLLLQLKVLALSSPSLLACLCTFHMSASVPH